MGIIKAKQVPPTAVPSDARMSGQTQQDTAGPDVEKDGVLENQVSQRRVQIDAEIEKRVVRKIDYHVPPLVTFLCMLCHLSR